MNMDEMNAERSGDVMIPICDKTVNHEITAEIILPDYQPELRKLLNVTEKIFSPAKYISASGVECNGTVDYKVIYIGSDGELYTTTASSEYEVNAPTDDVSGIDISEGMTATVCTVCDGTTSRVVSPRKVSVKSRMHSHICAYARADHGDIADTEAEGLQRLVKEAECCTVKTGTSDLYEVSDEIGGMGENVRVIGADANVFVGDIRGTVDSLSVSGDVNLKLLICKDGNRAETLVRKIHFNEEIDTDGETDASTCRVIGNVTEININTEEGRILCSLSLILDAVMANRKTWKYTADAYSVDRECDCELTSFDLPIYGILTNGNFSQSERIAVGDTDIPEGADIIDAWGRVVLDSCEGNDGRYTLSGRSKYNLLCEKDREYSVCTIELPVKYELEGAECNNVCFDALAEPVSCRARLEGDMVALDCEIAVGVTVLGKNTICSVNGISLGDGYTKQRSKMVVYYPADGETPWDVAKKYHVPAESLSAEKSYYLF